MDTKYAVDVLTLLYDRSLKSLLGYKDTAFTVELVEYMFQTFDDLAKQGEECKQFSNKLKDEMNKFFWEHNERFNFSYREMYIKYIHQKFSVPQKHKTRDGKTDYRKDLSDYFEAKAKANNQLKALGIDFYSIRKLLISALSLRNEKSHPESCSDTSLYREYEYLCNYFFLMEYLLYAFYHMIFAGSYEKGSLFQLTDSISMPVKLPVEDSSISFKDNLWGNKNFGHMMHVYVDYLLEPFSGMLFKSFFPTPWRLGNEAYNTLSGKVENLKKEEREIAAANKNSKAQTPLKRLSAEEKKYLEDKERQRDNINEQWKIEWRKELITVYSKKLLGGVAPMEREYYQTEYFDIYSNILIAKLPGNSTEELTCRFLDMLKDYLLRNSPSAVGMSQYTHLKKILQKIRSDYNQLKEHEVAKTFYINLENNRYADTLLDHMECVAEKRRSYPTASVFLGLMDCLIGQTLYIYMTELQTYVQNPVDASNFINVMKDKDIMKWADSQAE